MQAYSFECHVPVWTPVDTLNIPGNRIDHAFLEPNISAVSLNPQPSTLYPLPSTLYPQPSTLDPEP